MKIYSWSVDRFHVDAQVAGEELERIRKATGGVLSAEAVVKASKAKNAPLHPEFEWDDAAAAEKYRNDQARNIINHIRIKTAEVEEPVHQYFSVRRGGYNGYYDAPTVSATEELRKIVLEDTLRLVQQANDKLAQVEGLVKVKATAKRLAADLQRTVTRAQKAAARV